MKNAPAAAPRSSGWNDAWMIASDPGVTSAPPTPWRSLAATSTSMVGATAHATDARVNHTTPITRTLRLP